MIEQLKAALAPFALEMDAELGDDEYVHEPPFTVGEFRKAREAYEMLEDLWAQAFKVQTDAS